MRLLVNDPRDIDRSVHLLTKDALGCDVLREPSCLSQINNRRSSAAAAVFSTSNRHQQ